MSGKINPWIGLFNRRSRHRAQPSPSAHREVHTNPSTIAIRLLLPLSLALGAAAAEDRTHQGVENTFWRADAEAVDQAIRHRRVRTFPSFSDAVDDHSTAAHAPLPPTTHACRDSRQRSLADRPFARRILTRGMRSDRRRAAVAGETQPAEPAGNAEKFFSTGSAHSADPAFIACPTSLKSYEPQVKSRNCIAGCEPAPDVAVAVAPRLSVTVNDTLIGCTAPSGVLWFRPQMSVIASVGLGPV